MSKNKLVQLIFFIGFILGGILLSQLFVIIMLARQYGLEFTLTEGPQNLIWEMNAHQLLLQQMISQIFGLILPAFLFNQLFLKHHQQEFSQNLSLEPLGIFILFFISCMPLVATSAYLNQLIPFPEWVFASEEKINELLQKMLNLSGVSEFIFALIVVALVPALAEEWVFRGIMQKQIQQLTKNVWVALILTSVLFSSVHMQFLGFFPRFILGLILGYVFFLTNNLWYPILLHFMNNGVQVVILFVSDVKQIDKINTENELPNVFLTVISTFAAMVIAHRMYIKNKNQTSHG